MEGSSDSEGENFLKVWTNTLVINNDVRKCGVSYGMRAMSRFMMLPFEKYLELFCTYHLMSYLIISFPRDITILLLKKTARIFTMTLKDYLIIYFEDTFTYVYFNYKREKLACFLDFVKQQTKERIGTVIYFSYKSLICKVLTYAHDPRVVHFISTELAQTPECNYNIVQVLKKHVLGYLTYLDNKLVSKSCSEITLRHCLLSLSNVMVIMGSEGVTDIRLKLINTFRTGLPSLNKQFPVLVLKVWTYFIHSVDLTLMGPFLSTIIICILPLMDMFPKYVSALLYFLIVENENIFIEYIPELHFVPKSPIPIMVGVWKTIQDHLDRISKTFQTDISASLNYIRNESTQVRIHALSNLEKKIYFHSKTIYEALLQNDSLDPVILELIDCLMQTLKEPNSDLQVACAKCIGEIGAIDPSRIENKLLEMVSHKLSIVVLESDEFAYICINELVRGLQNANNPLGLNTFASSIQEVLKLYFENKPGSAAKFLIQFPPHIKSLLESLMVSRYRYMKSHFRRIYPYPITGSSLGKNTFEWANAWANEMITFLTDKTFSEKLFSACSPCLKVDKQTLLFFLPYIFLETVLQSSATQLWAIEREMKTILSWKLLTKENCKFECRKYRLYSEFEDIDPASNMLKHGLDEHKRVSIVCELLYFLQRNLIGDIRLKKDDKIKVKGFLDRFPKRVISYASYLQQEYYHALFYLEKDSVKRNEDNTSSCLRPLRNIYCKIGDIDSLHGVTRMVSNPLSIEDLVLNHTVSGNLEDAIVGYEYLCQKYKYNKFHRGLIQCYLNMDQPFIALQVTSSLFEISSRVRPEFYNEVIEVLLNNLLFDDMNDVLSTMDQSMLDNWCWGIDLGCVMNYCVQGKRNEMLKKLYDIRQHLIICLTVICDHTLALYRQGYSYIVRLHLLNELEKYTYVLDTLPGVTGNHFNRILCSEMEMRQKILPERDLVLQRILTMRKLYLKLLQNRAKNSNKKLLPFIKREIGKIGLMSSRLARKSGNFHKSFAMLEMTDHYCPVDTFIERAKLLKAKGEISEAIFILEQGINHYFTAKKSDTLTTSESQKEMLCAEAKLLLARYNDEGTNVDFFEGYDYYNEATDAYPSEKGFVYFAQYLQNMSLSNNMNDSTPILRDLKLVTASYFGKSLQYGAHFIYQSMPCILTLWLDYGSQLASTKVKRGSHIFITSIEEQKLVLQDFNLLLEMLLKKLPSYMFMTAFSQLLSRICHPESSSFEVLRKIIASIIVSYPHQAMWMIISVFKSSHPLYRKRSQMILALPEIKNNKDLCSFISSFNQVTNTLIEVCQKKVSETITKVSLRNLSRDLPNRIKNFPNVMVPCQKFRTILLPNYLESGRKIEYIKHAPFPTTVAFISDFEDEVEILHSMQKPKKVVIIGSDGAKYILMFKNMDDLRIDSRIMEFNTIVNMYLRRNAESRDRCLYIRTYSAVPLDYCCGLIEWVPNLSSFRNIITQFQDKLGGGMEHGEIRKLLLDPSKPMEVKRENFSVLLENHPPVFHEFFYDNFPSPESWYRGRLSYTRTAAVMSIVGFIVGLGDRHGENILFDVLCGDTVHVDFNCIFNKGEGFHYPELVPFRLTQNMVKAMGPTGTEGPFKKCCELTTRVVRTHEAQLMAVIKPFLYDPEPVRPNRFQSRKSENIEVMNETARHHIQRMGKRLKGAIQFLDGTTQDLSVEGQVKKLIEEATSLNNLCQMYFGWAPFL